MSAGRCAAEVAAEAVLVTRSAVSPFRAPAATMPCDGRSFAGARRRPQSFASIAAHTVPKCNGHPLIAWCIVWLEGGSESDFFGPGAIGDYPHVGDEFSEYARE
jgi:hypothetical protein